MSKTGTHFYTDKKSGRKFVIETIDNSETNRGADWGDIDPATKTVQGSYGTKYKGAIKEKDSIITEENGFSNIKTLGIGVSPYWEIDKILNSNS